jgi:myo-inositol-1(or 4)-monophosphatase
MSADRLALARQAATAGGRVAADRFRESVRVETKAHRNDRVSEADHEAQARVVETIAAESDAPIVGEEDETAMAVPDEGPAWVVDPIDGTANYLRGIRVWTTSVAAVTDGEPVAAVTAMPALEDTVVADEGTRLNGDPVRVSDRTDLETFGVAALGWGPHGERDAYRELAGTIIERCGDMRRFGSMQTALAWVATGGLDAAIATRQPNPWDSIAGVHMIRQAGGTVTALDGDRWHHDSTGLVASNGESHGRVLELARDVAAASG